MNEVASIVRETENTKPEAEQQVFESCLRLVGSNRSQKENDIGFCLLARMVEKSGPNTLRSMQSRLANRFSQIAEKFSFAGCLFVREVLIKNPHAGELHSSIVHKIIEQSIDAATESNDKTFRGLAAELYALRGNNESISILVKTLDLLLNNEKIKKISQDVLQLSTIGVSSHRFSLISLLFECLALTIGSVLKNGVYVNRKDVISIIELGIKTPQARPFAFICLRSLCVNAKYSLIPMIARIVSTLIGDLENPDVDLIRTLAFISTTFGPITSTLYKHFYVIFTALKQPLHLQNYGEHAANLLSSIIEGAAALIKPEVFITVQKSVCESAIRHPNVSIYLQLLAAFMALNNEYVPSPLHVARIVASRTGSTSSSAHRLKALCDVAARPRITDIADVKAKKTLSLKEQKTIETTVEIEKIEEEIIEAIEDAEEVSNSSDVEIVDASDNDEVEDERIVILEEPTTSKVQNLEKRKIENVEKTTSPKKKKKTAVPEVKTTLLDGEASVDDILNFFDPS